MQLNFLNDPQSLSPKELHNFSECKKGLHSYFKSPYKDEEGNHLCKNCRRNNVNWQLLKLREFPNIEVVVNEVRKDWWRNYWWNIAIDNIALQKLKSVPLENLKTDTEKRIKNSVGKVYAFNGKIEPYRDGYQTPFKGNIIFYGQHALATCCRKCIEYWHGIPQGKKLTESQINYLSLLTFEYVKARYEPVNPVL